MNSVFWLMYAGDISERYIIGFLILLAVVFLSFIAGLIVYSEFNYVPKWGKKCIVGVTLFYFFLILWLLIAPAKQTMYIAAFHKASEIVVTSDAEKQAVDRIKKYLDERIVWKDHRRIR